MNYYAGKMRARRYQCFSYQMNNWQPWQLKNQNPRGRAGANSSADPAHLPQKWAWLFTW
jgi:hypothetical protein